MATSPLQVTLPISVLLSSCRSRTKVEPIRSTLASVPARKSGFCSSAFVRTTKAGVNWTVLVPLLICSDCARSRSSSISLWLEPVSANTEGKPTGTTSGPAMAWPWSSCSVAGVAWPASRHTAELRSSVTVARVYEPIVAESELSTSPVSSRSARSTATGPESTLSVVPFDFSTSMLEIVTRNDSIWSEGASVSETVIVPFKLPELLLPPPQAGRNTPVQSASEVRIPVRSGVFIERSPRVVGDVCQGAAAGAAGCAIRWPRDWTGCAPESIPVAGKLSSFSSDS